MRFNLGRARRWSNITLGIVFTVLGLIDLAETAANPSAWAILIGLSEIAATVLIVCMHGSLNRKHEVPRHPHPILDVESSFVRPSKSSAQKARAAVCVEFAYGKDVSLRESWA